MVRGLQRVFDSSRYFLHLGMHQWYLVLVIKWFRGEFGDGRVKARGSWGDYRGSRG